VIASIVGELVVTMLEEQRIQWIEQNTRVCPINNTCKLVGGKFTTLILRNMMHRGQTRFNQFLEIEEINAKVLSARLKEMEKDGLIKREVFHEIPVRVEYTLTEKGRALESILYQMAAFSIEYCAKDVFKDGKARRFEEVYGFRLSNITLANGLERDIAVSGTLSL
jgi:DNA-binding HxlR family transcriptional regulator